MGHHHFAPTHYPRLHHQSIDDRRTLRPIHENHPFIDGNKRSGAFSFVWFLRRVKRLDTTRMSPEALTALTLLIAESNPKDKPKMVGLVCRLLIDK